MGCGSSSPAGAVADSTGRVAPEPKVQTSSREVADPATDKAAAVVYAGDTYEGSQQRGAAPCGPSSSDDVDPTAVLHPAAVPPPARSPQKPPGPLAKSVGAAPPTTHFAADGWEPGKEKALPTPSPPAEEPTADDEPPSVPSSGTLRGHSGVVLSVAVGPCGETIATAGDDNTIRLWSLSGRTCTAILTGHTSAVTGICFAPAGSTLMASSSWDGTARLWDVATGACKAVLKGHSSRVTGVSFSPDGSTLATSSWDGTVILRNLEGHCHQMKTRVLKGHTRAVSAVAFSSDGKLIASASWDGSVRLWDSSTGVCTAELRGHSSDWISSVAFSPDSAHVLFGSRDGTARLFTTAGQEVAVFKAHEGWVSAVAFSDDGSTVATGGDDKTVRIWRAGDGQEIGVACTHDSHVRSVAFLNGISSAILVSAGWDMGVHTSSSLVYEARAQSDNRTTAY